MLELIVLGQIPGTNVYISFYFVLVGLMVSAVACLVAAVFLNRYHAHTKQEQQNIEDQAI